MIALIATSNMQNVTEFPASILTADAFLFSPTKEDICPEERGDESS